MVMTKYQVYLLLAMATMISTSTIPGITVQAVALLDLVKRLQKEVEVTIMFSLSYL